MGSDAEDLGVAAGERAPRVEWLEGIVPADVTVPNTETVEALRQARYRKDLTEYCDLRELIAAFA